MPFKTSVPLPRNTVLLEKLESKVTMAFRAPKENMEPEDVGEDPVLKEPWDMADPLALLVPEVPREIMEGMAWLA